MAEQMEITLEFHDHQHAHQIDLFQLECSTKSALPFILSAPGPDQSHLLPGTNVEVSLVDDATIASIHAEFMSDPTPTDVITFQHGEILISTETGFRQARDHQQPLHSEILLYVIHGLLHLHGHEDASHDGAAVMKRIQEQIRDQILNA